MCAITGITGKVGGQAARNLISRELPVGAVLPPNFYPETSFPAARQNLVRAAESRETFA
jgi:hypothetical protein